MKHEQSDETRRSTIRRAGGGCPPEKFGRWRLAGIDVGSSLHDLVDGLLMAAARRNIEQTRAW